MELHVNEVIKTVPQKAEVVKDAPAKDVVGDDKDVAATTKEPVAKSYTQAEVDEITKKVKDNARRKRDEARQETAALRRILAERGNGAQQQAQPQQAKPAQPDEAPKAPQREQYQDDNAYFQAVVDYRADLKVREHLDRREKADAEQHARTSAEQLERAFESHQEKARAKYEDFDDVVHNPSLPQLHPVVIHALKALENGMDIAYEIGKTPGEAMRLSQLHPILQLKELGKIEAKLATPSAPAGTPAKSPQAQAAPAPVAARKPPLPAPLNPVTPKDATPDSDEPSDTDSDAVWLKKRQKQLREAGKR